MFKYLSAAAIAISLFVSPLLAQTHETCNSVAGLGQSTAESRDRGISLSTLISVINSNDSVSYQERQAITTFVVDAYNMNLPPETTYRVVYEICMGV
jgi:hypothetical protein